MDPVLVIEIQCDSICADSHADTISGLRRQCASICTVLAQTVAIQKPSHNVKIVDKIELTRAF